MTSELANLAARLRRFFSSSTRVGCQEEEFDTFALELFTLQFAHNAAYRRLCETRRAIPGAIEHWTQIPAVPASAFKEFDLTCLSSDERTTVFHSSGTSERRPSRHFHSAESLAIYEASLWPWFARHLLVGMKVEALTLRLLILTPPSSQAPHSSLVHMFETVRRQLGIKEKTFTGRTNKNGAWDLDFESTSQAMERAQRGGSPMLLLGTAFSFVNLEDMMEATNLQFQLPPGSRVMETGGYKGRSRSLPKTEQHALITQRLGVPSSHIVCEYGMSELSSQAYDHSLDKTSFPTRVFRFPLWARVQILSPETGREVSEGEVGLIRVLDLANVYSVLAIQTEDLGVRRGDGFELLGRAAQAESRGCSMMTMNS